MGAQAPTDPYEMMAQDPQLFIRVLASKFPHPAIRRLVDWSASGNTPPRGAQRGPLAPPPMSAPPTTMQGRLQSGHQPMAPDPADVPQPEPATAPGVATAENAMTPETALEDIQQ